MRIAFAGLTALLVAGAVAAAPADAGNHAVHACKTYALKVSRGPIDSALGNYRQTIRLRNTTHTTCSLSGWFKVKLLDAQSRPLSSTEQRITQDYFGMSPKPIVKVKPGAGASFAIDTIASATLCQYSSAVAVTPPGAVGSDRVSMNVLACGHFAVLPVQPDNRAIHP